MQKKPSTYLEKTTDSLTHPYGKGWVLFPQLKPGVKSFSRPPGEPSCVPAVIGVCFSSQPATLHQLLSFQPFCLLGRSGETLAIKPSRWPWALGVCLLPALSCWYRLCCLRYLAHSVLVSPPFYWLPAPSLQATFVPAKWGDLPSLSTAAPFPGQLCRDTRSPPAPDLPRPLRTSVVPLCPCLNPESNVPSIFPCASFISTAQLLRQVIHPVKARTGCSLLFYQTRRVTCMSSVSVS